MSLGWGELPTATLSDALDRLGLDGSMPGILPLRDGQRVWGRAYTVGYVPAADPPGTVGDYLDAVAPGEVVVIDNGGLLDATVWGDILTAMAHARGVAGTVIDGVNRDVAKALELGYAVYSRGRHMRTGKDRVEVAAEQVPVSVGGVRVEPGDMIVGDDDGVVRVPRAREEDVLALAQEIEERESRIMADVLTGATITEARARHGYHLLQRRDA
ncbi:MAG: RraA family protein [Actinobacteria bacterium]|nr:RraA family protein [Actinomycetota bacterium]